MTGMTLAELKVQNEAEESALVAAETIPQDDKVETETEPNAETEALNLEPEGHAELEGEEKEPEDWMKSSESSGESEDIPNSAWKAARTKYKAKLGKVEDRHEEELNKLRVENEGLRKSNPKPLNKPKRSDFSDSDDPDDAYIDAVTDWKIETSQAKGAAKVKEREAIESYNRNLTETSKQVDEHYKRAITLSEKSGIKPETYQAADLNVRNTVESVFPDGGDAVTDRIIEYLGEGSEKVMFNLGINAARREEFRSLLMADKSGLKAAAFLGELKTRLNVPSKKTTNAPPPATQINGDAVTSSAEKGWKKKYDAADKKGDIQARFDARREAKKSGVNVSNW